MVLYRKNNNGDEGRERNPKYLISPSRGVIEMEEKEQKGKNREKTNRRNRRNGGTGDR